MWLIRGSNPLLPAMKEIDLHGMTHKEAIEFTENWILLESHRNELFNCRIITGNSYRLQDKIIKQVLDKHKFEWFISPWNLGQIIVTFNYD